MAGDSKEALQEQPQAPQAGNNQENVPDPLLEEEMSRQRFPLEGFRATQVLVTS
jgi:hypothetical protein